MQYGIENLTITKTISVHTPKTTTSYRQDMQRVETHGKLKQVVI